MYLMYVDESGDIGISNSPTNYFILSGLIIHELKWRQFIDDITLFRRNLKTNKNLKLREEIHAVNFINKPGNLLHIKRNERLDILKQCINFLNQQSYLNLITVCISKANKASQTEVFEYAWSRLIQRFENTIGQNNFRGPKFNSDKGIIITDKTDEKTLRNLIRKMHQFNIVPNSSNLYSGGNRNLKIEMVIEDPVMRDSKYSFIHQMVDVIVYFARQLYETNYYVKQKGAKNYYKHLGNIIVSQVSTKHPLHIVEG